jgi:hypothetical protein
VRIAPAMVDDGLQFRRVAVLAPPARSRISTPVLLYASGETGLVIVGCGRNAFASARLGVCQRVRGHRAGLAGVTVVAALLALSLQRAQSTRDKARFQRELEGERFEKDRLRRELHAEQRDKERLDLEMGSRRARLHPQHVDGPIPNERGGFDYRFRLKNGGAYLARDPYGMLVESAGSILSEPGSVDADLLSPGDVCELRLSVPNLDRSMTLHLI